MNVLLCGAQGFIGRHVKIVLESRGHRVISGVSSKATVEHVHDTMRMDFGRDITIDDWLRRLEGIDTVINAVGVLRDSRERPMSAVHATTPVALFDACALVGVRRVIHFSALGIDGNPTQYAITKLIAEKHLLNLAHSGKLCGIVLRPSIVFGQEGESTKLFMALAKLPVLVLPRPVISARVQPVHVKELAEAVGALFAYNEKRPFVFECGGAEAVTLAAFIVSLRRQLGKTLPRILKLPDPLTKLSARLGDLIQVAPWCSETLALLGRDNVADPLAFAALLGRPATPFSRLLKLSRT